MDEISKIQNWPLDQKELHFVYKDMSLKYLEGKAEWFHNFVLKSPDVYLETKIKGNKEHDFFYLDVFINRRNEKQLKRKENTHFQKTNI